MLDDQLRGCRHRGGMGASRHQNLLPQRLALALGRQRGGFSLKLLKGREALRRVGVRHVAVGVILGPVVAVNEAGFDAIGLELLKQDGMGGRAVDAHAGAQFALLDLVFDGGGALFEDGLEVAEAGGLIGLCLHLRHLACLEGPRLKRNLVAGLALPPVNHIVLCVLDGLV